MALLIPLERRFWRKVKKTDGCWLWTGATHEGGYGVVKADRASVDERPRNIGAHRAAWLLTYGAIPQGLDVCHRCDNPPCVRPDHLFLGTRKENLEDAVTKKRFGRFQRNHDDVKRLAAQGLRQSDIAARFGMTQAHVSKILSRRYEKAA